MLKSSKQPTERRSRLLAIQARENREDLRSACAQLGLVARVVHRALKSTGRDVRTIPTTRQRQRRGSPALALT